MKVFIIAALVIISNTIASAQNDQCTTSAQAYTTCAANAVS